jgi:hypothetical protein
MVRVLLLIGLNLAVVTGSIALAIRYGACIVLPVAAVAHGVITALLSRRESLWLERTRQGLCTRCGYDLRASIIRCPECGHSMDD